MLKKFKTKSRCDGDVMTYDTTLNNYTDKVYMAHSKVYIDSLIHKTHNIT